MMIFNIISKSKNTVIDMKKYLIVGLGNIGAEYKNTRHNIGFKILDFLAENEAIKFETKRLGDVAKFRYKGKTFVLLKPSTYMNLSGKSVKYWINKENISLDNVLIICDDLNLPFGTIRLKIKGSDGGHNGLKDIITVLNTSKFSRYRFGVGNGFSKGKQIDYVLGEWSEEETEKLKERFEKSSELIKSFGFAGINNTMSAFNGK